MKAQISLEYLSVIGLVLVLLVPLFFYSISETQKMLNANKASDAVSTIARTVDTVYAIGPGTKHYVTIELPRGVQSLSLANKTILLKVTQFGGVADVFAATKAPLTGSFSIDPGQHKLAVEMLDSGYVEVSSG